MAIIDRDIFFVNKLFCFECDDQLNSKYLFYYLQTSTFQNLFKNSITGLIGGVSLEKVRNLPMILPSIEKQNEVVAKLDSAFAEIDLLEVNLESSDEKANQFLQSILYSAFSSSEAIKEPSDSAAQQVLGANDGYPLVRLGDLCDTISGLWTGKKPPFEKAIVIRNTNFTKDCNLDLSNVAVLDVETKQLKSRTLLPGDLIIEKSGGGPKQPVGRVVHFNEKSGTYSLSNFTSALRVKESREVLPVYLRHFLYFQYISGQTENMQSHSTGIRNLNMHQFLDVEVPLPSLERQRETVEMLDKVFAEIESLKAQIKVKKDSAAALRQSLLNSAFAQQESVA
jgi:type I restriction enzyme S subunit